MRLVLLLSAFFVLAAPGRAQVDVGASVGPEAFAGIGGAGVVRSTSSPLALALSLCYDATTWTRIGVSTASPAADLTSLALRGYYKLELVEMILLAVQSGKTLAYLTVRREKGETLRGLAESLSVGFDALEEQALKDDRLVALRLESLWRVTPYEAASPPGGRP
jgi:hypothetical protein